MPSSVGVTRCASVNASRLLCHSTSMSGSPASMRSIISASSPNGRRPWPAGLQHGVEHVDRVVRLDGDLEAEVAGVAGAGQRDAAPADLGRARARSSASESTSGISVDRTVRERGPCTARMP
jgi:hypothetical protein